MILVATFIRSFFKKKLQGLIASTQVSCRSVILLDGINLIKYHRSGSVTYELLKEEDEGCLKNYRKRCMQEMHDKLSFGPKFEGVYDLDSGEAFLEVIEKEHHSTVVVVHIYKNGIKGCEALNSCLDCLATEYPTVKFCRIDAVASGAAERFSDEYLPTLLVYKAGELLGNFLACTQHLNEEFFATDVEAFLNSYGLLPEKELLSVANRGSCFICHIVNEIKI
uniref:Phosducin b n=1 Tax=Amphilophus citrinellus TaxID=61819 RepID=A0A3Q0RWG3_AMPCI